MRKMKVSLYLEPAQLRLINEITNKLGQKRSLIFREAVNCYLTLYQESKKAK